MPHMTGPPLVKTYLPQPQAVRYLHLYCDPRKSYRGGPQLRFERQSSSTITASLLRTSRLIYTEAQPVLYDTWTFCPPDHACRKLLFCSRQIPFVLNLRHLRLPLSYPQDHFASETMGSRLATSCGQIESIFPKLKSFQLPMDQPEYLL